MRHEIVCSGVRVPIAANVLTWEDHGMRFHPLDHVRRRTSMIVLHWTGAENAPSDVFRNMRDHKDSRGRPEPLSVHFVIDQAATVWQFTDAGAFLAHAKGVNDRSVGIEIVNRADAYEDVPDKGILREIVTETIHGRKVKYADFLPAQTAAALSLVEALCTAYELPMVVPMHGDDVHTGVLTPRELGTYRGVIPHYATKSTKRDCGPKLLRAVAARAQARKKPIA